jgi:hypothetical protein
MSAILPPDSPLLQPIEFGLSIDIHMEKMKFCKDCRRRSYVEPRDIDEKYSRCTGQSYTDPVTGISRFELCSFVRMAGQPCGPDAKLFEAKT